MIDIVDITDELNAILDEYAMGEESGVVDLDAWATCDLADAHRLIGQALEIRAGERLADGEILEH